MQSNKFIVLFISKAVALYLLWYFIYEQWLAKVGWLDNFIIDHLVKITLYLLNFLGYTTFVYEHTFGIDGSNGVFIGNPCNGLELMALFAGFVLIFKGSWKNKIWFIPLGIIVIYMMNIVRLLILTIIAKVAPETLDFNHKYTFTVLLYVLVFLGWVLWVNKFATKDNK